MHNKDMMPHDVKYLEAKRIQKEMNDKVKDRVTEGPSMTVKKSLLQMLFGIVFAGLLTLFEMAMKNAVGAPLYTFYKIGFFISLMGLVFLPYGFYNLIVSLKR